MVSIRYFLEVCDAIFWKCTPTEEVTSEKWGVGELIWLLGGS
jgi:hypothetical protein